MALPRSLGVLSLISLSFVACHVGGGSLGDPANFEREGWTITSVEDRGEGCAQVRYVKPAAWECTPEQLAVLNTYQGYDQYADDGDGLAGVGFDQYAAAPLELLDLPCEELVELRRDQSLAYQKSTLAQSYQAQLAACIDQTDVGYFQNGAPVDFCGPSYETDDGGSDAGSDGGDLSMATGGSPASDGASQYSTTNNQVKAVEEADYVKNDSGHIYLLTANGLEIFESWPVAEANRLKTISFDNAPRRLLLAGDRLVVFLRTGTEGGNQPSQQDCTYGYGCDMLGEGGGTEVRVFDVSDPASPEELKKFSFSGGYLASRRIGDQVFLVVIDRLEQVAPQSLLELPFPADVTAEDVDAAYGHLQEQLADGVAAAPEAAFLPTFGSAETASSCQRFFRAPEADGSTLLSVASFDIQTLAAPRRSTIATTPGFVYASAESLYVAVRSTGVYDWDATTDASSIHKFSIAGDSPVYRGTAALRGHVLNQFAMDEREGILRVASSNGWVPNADVSSSLTTFREVSGRLSRYGELTGIAPTEDIRSVRFDGERGFVVTFKKTDPLYVLDLSNPAAPFIRGELKIPGFSTYMHPLDANHLLAVGFDADDQGSFAFFNGIQVQLFDISVLSNPQLLHKLSIGTRGTTSEALTNHLAFNYFPAEKVLALPITICEGGGQGTFGDQMTFSGVLALDIDVTAGIHERGRLPFADPVASSGLDYGEGGCFSWWTEASSNVKRSIFFEDYLYGISDDSLRAGQLDDLGNVLVSIPLGQ